MNPQGYVWDEWCAGLGSVRLQQKLRGSDTFGQDNVGAGQLHAIERGLRVSQSDIEPLFSPLSGRGGKTLRSALPAKAAAVAATGQTIKEATLAHS